MRLLMLLLYLSAYSIIGKKENMPKCQKHLLAFNDSEENAETLSRTKRSFRFPTQSWVQVIWQVVYPDVKYEHYAAKFIFGIYNNIPFPKSYVKESDVFEIRKKEGEKRKKRSKREASRQDRMDVYSQIEASFNMMGLDGHQCLLRAICEVTEVPFHHGLFGEFLNVIFKASTLDFLEEEEENSIFREFIDAENHGQTEGNCHLQFPLCKKSLMEFLPGTHHFINV